MLLAEVLRRAEASAAVSRVPVHYIDIPKEFADDR